MRTLSGDVNTGTLLYKISEEDEIRNSKWIVTMDASDSKPMREVQLQEREILRLVERRSSSSAKLPSPSAQKGKKRKVGGNFISCSDSDTNKNKSLNGSSQQAIQNDSESPTPSSLNSCSASQVGSIAPQSKPEISDREKRRMRREALLEEEKELVQSDNNTPRYTKRQKNSNPISKTNTNTNNASSKIKGKKKKAFKHDPNEECVKVKMNTGTLYLYRGLNRRAVFIRRV